MNTMAHSDAPMTPAGSLPEPTPVAIPIDGLRLRGDLVVPAHAHSVVVFAHGGGSGRDSPRNQYVARELQALGIATLLFDLLTPTEAAEDARSGYWRFEIALLSRRIEQTCDWLGSRPDTRDLTLGIFGSSTGAAAALGAAARMGPRIKAVVSRGGRVDFVADVLPDVIAATLLIVGERDEGTLHLNRHAYKRLTCERQFAVVGGASRLFEEPGTLAQVATLATAWFRTHLLPKETT